MKALSQLYSFFSSDNSEELSQIDLLANPDVSNKLEIQTSISKEELYDTSKKIGIKLGSKANNSLADIDKLTEVLFCINDTAKLEQRALAMASKAGDKAARFFANNLELISDFVLKPLIDGIQASDVDTNLQDFKNLCKTYSGYFTNAFDSGMDVYQKAQQRMLAIYDRLFAKKIFPPEFSDN